eukprot:SM000387S14695  [mRNA]  locus=s387:29582:30284:- [translate_table: standard]
MSALGVSAASAAQSRPRWQPRCARGGEWTGTHDLLRNAILGTFVEAGYTVALENSSIRPLTAGTDGRLHTRRADLVASALGGGRRVNADMVTTDCFDFRSGNRSSEEAGYAVRQAAGVKERKYSDQSMARRHGQQNEQPGFNIAGSLDQVFRMHLAISLQRSLAFVIHLRAGRALAADSGFRQGDVYSPASYSDLHLLTRGY